MASSDPFTTDGKSQTSRREFLSHSAVVAGTAAFAGTLGIARSAHAAGSDQLKVGLIGCGGRGSGAAADALQADKNVALTAMGDAFADRVESSLKYLTKQFSGQPEKLQVSPDRCFAGFDAYQKVIDSGVDVVLLCTPPHFRPEHLAPQSLPANMCFAKSR